MDKILLAIGALALGVGLLFLPRTSRGSVTVDCIGTTPTRPGVDCSDLADDFNDGEITVGSSPKGLRNNNPFNLEYRNIGWRGELGTDGRFSVFDTAQNGIRAGMINIHTKMTRDGKVTVRQLISTLSPSHENPTEAFISFVSRRMNVSPDQPLTFGVHIISLSKAIIRFENGEQPFTFDELEAALQQTGRL